MKEKILQKLTSRKLWAAILAAAGAVVAAVCGDSLTPEVVEAIRYGVYAMIAYIFGEGAVDIARLIADAIKAAYEIPDIGEILGEVADTPDTGEEEP